MGTKSSEFPGSRIAIAGTGRMAQALARLLVERGQPLVAIAGRSKERTAQAVDFAGGGVAALSLAELPRRASRVLIAVSDQAIPEVAAALAGAGMSAGVALHTSGANGPEALARLAEAGASCGVWHPLQTVPSPGQGCANLPGASFAVAGEGEAARWALELTALLSGTALRIRPEHMPLYHAAAVMASNYVVALVDAAAKLMQAAGVGEAEALRALAPLTTASAAAAFAHGPARALTGPIARGDTATVERHLAALAAAPFAVGNLYRAAGLHTVALARRAALQEPAAAALKEILKSHD
jgi:predicted short-subunit dehydrogenase-like oxidoreductase (DUF2520 family)